jgi:hypothetical protein
MLLLSVLFGGFAFSAAPAVDQIAGVYKKQFENGTIDGHGYHSENILELVKYSDKALYFRVHLDFFNGHVCNAHGIAGASGETFQFRDKHYGCELEISRSEKEVVLRDVSDGNCQAYCGSRGSLSEVKFELAKKRKIRYLPVVLKSREYRQAVKDFEK